MNENAYHIKREEYSTFKIKCPECEREWIMSRSKNVNQAGPAELIGDDAKSIYAKFNYHALCAKCKTAFDFKLFVTYEME